MYLINFLRKMGLKKKVSIQPLILDMQNIKKTTTGQVKSQLTHLLYITMTV